MAFKSRKLHYVFAAMLCITLSGCAWLFTTVTGYKDIYDTEIYRDSKSKKNYLVIKRIVMSHCGCTDAVAQKFENGKEVYTLWYGCGFHTPQKVISQYDEKGRLQRTITYNFVYDSAFRDTLTSVDKLVLKKIAEFRLTDTPRLPEYKLCEKKITGFILATSQANK